jgi:hypothetical protein
MSLAKNMKWIFAVMGKGVFALIALLMTLWAVGAIYYSNLPWQFLRAAAAIAFPAACVVLFFAVKPFRKAVLIFFAVFAAVVVWWLLIPASNNRNWQPDVARLPSAVIDGNMLTVRNIRNCDYRTETDYTAAYYDKTFDLSKLQGADLFISFWGPTLIAHTIMSFDFADNQYLCISIETRKEMGEDYSAIKGFFKQYELMYIVADERDVVRLRTNFRKETVYLYRLTAPAALAREVLLDYLKSVNQLNTQPEWYNALTENCTTAIRGHTAKYAHGKMSWKILANGYLDTLLYERKVIDTNMPFEQLKALSCINDKAVKADNSPDFSIAIRRGLPNPRQR